MPKKPASYLMENLEEAIRLEVKTNPTEVRNQAVWCGLKPGFHVLDAGCGPGKITSILHEMIQPGGKILGLDYSEARINHAREHYARDRNISFEVRDLRKPIEGVGPFDLIWVRFVLEYNRAESFQIVKNLTTLLKPDGHLCLLDLDHNSLCHYEMPVEMEAVLGRISARLEENFNFDPYSGRKLYAYLYDLGYRDIQVNLIPHHLIYGKIKEGDMFNWIKKAEVISSKTTKLFQDYPGGHKTFFTDFRSFFLDPRRFTYTPLILCKGMKPPAPSALA